MLVGAIITVPNTAAAAVAAAELNNRKKYNN